MKNVVCFINSVCIINIFRLVYFRDFISIINNFNENVVYFEFE